jgi:aminoglycoside phosphotransferase (APT) family kinase protein
MKTVPPELLLRVPGCDRGEVPHCVRGLTGGRGVNSVWLVQTAAGDFVLRLRQDPVDRPGSFSRFELASHRIAAAAGLAPRVVDAAPDGHWLVMDYVDAPAWSEQQLLSDAGIDVVGAALRRLHALECPATLPRMDICGIAHGYLERIAKFGPEHAERAAIECAAIERVSRDLEGLSERSVLNHGDLMAANLLGPGPVVPPVLVDWEYAQRADPTWDLACLLAYYPALEQRRDRLLGAAGLAGAQDRQILSLQLRLFSRFNRLWQHAEAGNWIS